MAKEVTESLMSSRILIALFLVKANVAAHTPKLNFGPAFDRGMKDGTESFKVGMLNCMNNTEYKGLKKRKSPPYHSKRLPEQRCNESDWEGSFAHMEGSANLC